MTEIREIAEGRQTVGVDERPLFSLTTTPWGSTPTSVDVKSYLYENGAFTENTSTVFPSGSVLTVGDVITLKPFVPPAINAVVRVEIKFTAGGSVWEAFAWVDVTR